MENKDTRAGTSGVETAPAIEPLGPLATEPEEAPSDADALEREQKRLEFLMARNEYFRTRVDPRRNELIAKAMSMVRELALDAYNAHREYPYTSTNELYRHIRPVLSACGLTVRSRLIHWTVEGKGKEQDTTIEATG